MGGTKIVVFQLKDIVKKMIYLLIGIVVIIFLIIVFVPKEKAKEQETSALYKPGTYYSEIILHNSPVRVLVTVNDNEIENVTLTELDETQEVFYPLFKPTMENLSKEIVNNQTLDVPLTRESAYTEEILIDAIRTALSQAEIDA